MIRPSPKPSPSPKSPRRPLKKSGRIKPKKRTAGERERIYGPKGYIEWLHAQPCIACGVEGFTECAHVGNGGAGRKSDWTQTVPLCGTRFVVGEHTSTGTYGCHDLSHTMGRKSFEAWREIDLDEAAKVIRGRWQAFSKEGE